MFSSQVFYAQLFLYSYPWILKLSDFLKFFIGGGNFFFRKRNDGLVFILKNPRNTIKYFLLELFAHYYFDPAISEV